MKLEKVAHFRFYAELNDFLPAEKKQQEFAYHFSGKPSVKDTIEALGVPHPEVDLILANGHSVDFNFQLTNSDHLAVYPVFELLDLSPLIRLRPKPLRTLKFILDVNLGKLAKKLRMLGFDSRYKNTFSDAEVVQIATAENRIILTRDQGILKNKRVTRGYWIRSTNPIEQIKEVVEKFNLQSMIDPFHICLKCNGRIKSVAKEAIYSSLPERTRKDFDTFYKCSDCGKVYWQGSHYERMLIFIDQIKQNK